MSEEQQVVISRQRQWQLDRMKEGKCISCGGKSDGKARCPACRKKASALATERYRLKKLSPPVEVASDESTLP